MRRPGRRPGATETREEILAAARRLFAARGYDGATIRGIAAEAGVNPGLVHHFFGTKQQLFVTALDFPFAPSLLAQRIVSGPREEVGERLVHAFLTEWADPTGRAAILALLRSAITNEQTAAMFRQFIDATLLSRLMTALNVPREQMAAAMAQMVGLVLLRYVIRIEPLASASDEEIVRLVAPTIQRYIDGD